MGRPHEQALAKSYPGPHALVTEWRGKLVWNATLYLALFGPDSSDRRTASRTSSLVDNDPPIREAIKRGILKGRKKLIEPETDAANSAVQMSGYKPEIDGLRALAVLSVLFFHLGFSAFSGGYVGVDVFFVISGFLITRLIRDEVIHTGEFSFINFYLRRVRRLFPAFFFTSAISFMVAFAMFSPQHFQEFGGSVLYAIGSIANFYFWVQSGYFDTAATLKPLLHTWSLGVEEQFYLIWPLVLVYLLQKPSRVAAPIALLAAGIISFLLTLNFANGEGNFLNALPKVANWFRDGAATIFYLTPFRVFEFAIGGIVVWLIRFQPNHKWTLEFLVVLGISLIAYSIYTFTVNTAFPSINAIPACIGAALLICAGHARYSGMVLRSRPVVWLGKISYSLYLVHWPLIVFYRYYEFAALTLFQQLAICIVSVIVATGMYHFVEQPFRSHRSILSRPPAFALVCALLALILAIPSANVWANEGWLWRYPPEVAQQFSFKIDSFDNYVWTNLYERQAPFANNGKPKVLIIGDSQAGDLVNMMIAGGVDNKIDLRTIKAKMSEAAKIKSNRSLQMADVVILASKWPEWAIDLIPETVAYLQNAGVKKIFVLGRKRQSITGVQFLALYGINSRAIRLPANAATTQVNLRIKKLEGEFQFLDPLELFCNAAGCAMTSDDGYLILYDDYHLTPRGAKYLGGLLLENWGEKLFDVKQNS